jgi:hypothetical protein
MPIDHAKNRANGNALSALRLMIQGAPATTLTGRTTGLPIYEVNATDFNNSLLSGPNFWKIVHSMVHDNNKDLQKGYRQPTDHEDRNGNLPVAPPRWGYREYFLPQNRFPSTGYLRLVSDISNKRLFITPTHYDEWNDGGAARNPFFLLRRTFVFNPMFRI